MYAIKNIKNYYDEGFSICSKKMLEFEPGVTVLVGCNGIGKTTTLNIIADHCSMNDIPYIHYNNLEKGNSHGLSSAFFYGDYGLASALMSSSEGERITLNFGQEVKYMHDFIVTGKKKNSAKFEALRDALSDHKMKEKDVPKERFILLDGIDSGASIDCVLELKSAFKLMLEDAKKNNVELFIVISANEYELVDGSQCMDVTKGEYIYFDSYESYKKFILKTRKIKTKRYERLEKRAKKRQEKEEQEKEAESQDQDKWKRHRIKGKEVK